MRFRVVMHVLEYLAVYASGERSVARALTFLRRVLKACDGKPPVVVDRGPWYPWAFIATIHNILKTKQEVIPT